MDIFKNSNIGIHDNFFELGGHSLLAIKVMARIRDVVGIELPVLNIYENPTIAALAHSLTKASARNTAAHVDGYAQMALEQHGEEHHEGHGPMTLFHFGSADAPLFGVYSAPDAAAARQAAVLLCAPTGLEYMRTHYAVRLVASQLAKMGLHVLRFDYHGTGDSSGNIGAGQFDIWCDDIAVAAGKLLEISGVHDLTVVGLRLGAALAVEALASHEIKAKSLVLWDPVVSGDEYLSILERMHAKLVAKRRVPLRPTNELLGTRCPQDLRTAIQGFDIAERTLNVDVQEAALVVSGGGKKYVKLLNSMRRRWPETMFKSMVNPVDWESLQAAYGGRLTGPITRVVAEAAESLS
jgi:pimeloyl-ACP methyl ester carboxylesterase